jgi:hypothetical protein
MLSNGRNLLKRRFCQGSKNFRFAGLEPPGWYACNTNTPATPTSIVVELAGCFRQPRRIRDPRNIFCADRLSVFYRRVENGE